MRQLGHDIVEQATASDKGIDNLRKADLSVKNIGQVDVYTPKSSDPTKIARGIEKKDTQAAHIMVQTDISADDMTNIALRTWGKPNTKNIQSIFFQKSNGTIFRFNRPRE